MKFEPDLERLELAYANLEVESDYQIQELKSLANQGSSISPMYLGWVYQTGKLVKRDVSEAERWFLLSLERGHSLSAYYLGCLYLESGRSLEAIKVFEQGVSLGNLPCKYSLAVAVLDSDASIEEKNKARILLSEASQSGHVFAMRRMASIFFEDNSILGKLRGCLLLIKSLSKGVIYGARNIDDERLFY